MSIFDKLLGTQESQAQAQIDAMQLAGQQQMVMARQDAAEYNKRLANLSVGITDARSDNWVLAANQISPSTVSEDIARYRAKERAYAQAEFTRQMLPSLITAHPDKDVADIMTLAAQYFDAIEAVKTLGEL